MKQDVQLRVATTLTRLRETTKEVYSSIVESTGLPLNAVHSANRCHGRTLSLSDVYALAKHHDVHISDLIDGTSKRKTRKWPDGYPTYAELDDHVRGQLRSSRLGAGIGTFALARKADVNQTWIVREESGEIATIDLIRVERVALALGTTLTQWLI